MQPRCAVLVALLVYFVPALAFRPLNWLGALNDLKGPPQQVASSVPGQLEGEDWALLIAGSGGWGNYRHQADVCHAYQVLHRGGIPKDNIITMMADDIARNYLNPHQGRMFNSPGGPDVYEGVQIDYRGQDVNSKNFLAVLAGQAPMLMGNSSGKTIKAGPKDRVFVFFADHGAPGIVGMPTGPFLYADQLIQTITERADNGGFAHMVLYIEACEAGSMFEGMLAKNLSVYVTTAANAHESSWGTYCPGMSPAAPPEFTTCLGDLYSVAWMENSDHANLVDETLLKQFELVRRRTSNNGTYRQGSHVMQYGSLRIDEEPVADYLGFLNTGDGNVLRSEQSSSRMGSVPQREADLVPLWVQVTQAATPAAKMAALEALHAETGKRVAVDTAVRRAVSAILHSMEVQYIVDEGIPESEQPAASRGAPGDNALRLHPLTEAVVTQASARPAGTPLVDDWDCLRAMVAAWETSCSPLDQYGMQHTRAFANLCNGGVAPAQLQAAAAEACAVRPVLPAASA